MNFKNLKYGWALCGFFCLSVLASGPNNEAEEDCRGKVVQETLALRLPWTRPPRTIPGYAGPMADASGSYETRQLADVARIYTRLALDESSLDIFAVAQSDAKLREISFHLVEGQYLLGLTSLVDLETKPIFVVHAACVARLESHKIALLLNPSHWETDPNLSFSASATALYVLDRLVRGRHIKSVRGELGETVRNYLYGDDPIKEPDDNYTRRDPVERLYSRLYSEIVFIERYGTWTRREHAQMKTEELEQQYDLYWSNPIGYLGAVILDELKAMRYEDETLNTIVAVDILSHPLPKEWPLPALPADLN
ncbi:MAG: hypothetical protein KDD39_13800 [Bdellovibrionales bacterium]|nr:hypothetical protein [Bdellovibrionales bacterium]